MIFLTSWEQRPPYCQSAESHSFSCVFYVSFSSYACVPLGSLVHQVVTQPLAVSSYFSEFFWFHPLHQIPVSFPSRVARNLAARARLRSNLCYWIRISFAWGASVSSLLGEEEPLFCLLLCLRWASFTSIMLSLTCWGVSSCPDLTIGACCLLIYFSRTLISW